MASRSHVCRSVRIWHGFRDARIEAGLTKGPRLRLRPRKRWKDLVQTRQLNSCAIKHSVAKRLIDASAANNDEGLMRAQRRLVQDYYGKRSATTPAALP